MSDVLCVHEQRVEECADCRGGGSRAGSGSGRASRADQSGHETLLIFCPSITDDSVLHYSRRGDGYRLRAYVGRLAGRTWTPDDAPTAPEFAQRHPFDVVRDVRADQVAVTKTDRWVEIIMAANRVRGIRESGEEERGDGDR